MNVWVRRGGFRVRGDDFRARGGGFRVRGDDFRARGGGFWVRGDGFRPRAGGFRVRRDEFRARRGGFRVRGDGVRARGYRNPGNCRVDPYIQRIHSITANFLLSDNYEEESWKVDSGSEGTNSGLEEVDP
jgi:hypothetical protein